MIEKADDYGTSPRGKGARGVRDSAIALIGRQLLIIGFSLVLARILGPGSYGIVAQANIYMAFTTLLLDQGLTPALISRTSIDRRMVGAAAAVNLLMAFFLLLITLPLAPIIADFLATPELMAVLPVMAIGLLVKGASIVPRMLLTRRFRFGVIAVAEIASAAVGGVLGVVLAMGGFDFWAVVAQLMVTDVVALLFMLFGARPPLPNLRLTALRGTIGFGVRVFGGNFLSFASRNVDNLLVGKLFGTASLAQYSLAYRVLLTPVQMIGQAVTRVLFPALARERDVPGAGARLIRRSTSTIAFLAFPLMLFAAAASFDGVEVVLGPEWAPAAPVLAVLAVTGARQAVTSVNAPVLLGYARADIHLRFNLVAATVQILGMIVGAGWGMLGVAVGYTVAGILLTPLIFWIQRHLAGITVRTQLGAILPAAHASLWAYIAYALLYATELLPLPRLLLGFLLYGIVYFVVMLACHRVALRDSVANVLAVVRGTPS
jgi:PST family polysaccharide transporter